MDFLSKVASNIYPILYLGSLALFIIGIIVWANINDNDSVQAKGDKRLVVAIFLLVPIILVQFAWASRNCRNDVLKRAIESF